MSAGRAYKPTRSQEVIDAEKVEKQERRDQREADAQRKIVDAAAEWDALKADAIANPGSQAVIDMMLDLIRRDPGWWLAKYVYTYDQHDDELRVKKFPMERPYFPILLKRILCDKILILPKSRQLTTSWFLSALVLWKSLFFEGSEGYVQCLNEDTVDYFVQTRIKFIYDRLPDWQKLDKTSFSFCKSRMPANGSFITGLPSGADKARGRAPAIVVSDELAFQESGEAFGNTLPAIGGDGLAVAPSTPNMKNHFHRMCFPRPKDMKHIETIIPFPDYPKTRIERYEGHTVFFLHYTADPDKRSKEWYDAERAKFFAQGKPEEAWAQEY